MNEYSALQCAELVGVAYQTITLWSRKYNRGKTIGRRIKMYSEKDLAFFKKIKRKEKEST
jgi:DNA-binding transcriptional MerR regulator